MKVTSGKRSGERERQGEREKTGMVSYEANLSASGGQQIKL